jgi:hypothetical protein
VQREILHSRRTNLIPEGRERGEEERGKEQRGEEGRREKKRGEEGRGRERRGGEGSGRGGERRIAAGGGEGDAKKKMKQREVRGRVKHAAGGVVCGVRSRKHERPPVMLTCDELRRRFKKAKWQLIMAGFDCS